MSNGLKGIMLDLNDNEACFGTARGDLHPSSKIGKYIAKKGNELADEAVKFLEEQNEAFDRYVKEIASFASIDELEEMCKDCNTPNMLKLDMIEAFISCHHGLAVPPLVIVAKPGVDVTDVDIDNVDLTDMFDHICDELRKQIEGRRNG